MAQSRRSAPRSLGSIAALFVLFLSLCPLVSFAGKIDPEVLAEHFTKTGKTVYEVLGVYRNSPPGNLRSAFRKKSLELHPDKNPGQEAEFLQLVEAYEIALAIAETRGRPSHGIEPTGVEVYDEEATADMMKANFPGADPDNFALPGKRELILVIYFHKATSWKWNVRWTSKTHNVIGGGEDEDGVYMIRGYYDMNGSDGKIWWEKHYFEDHRVIRYDGKKYDTEIKATWVDNSTGETGSYHASQAQ
eukprot:CAMPEP_0197866232 /NCGR_PEP_ID=MMETSP1438-20131217/44105_1 /TAXON_ID=1461541 /ORGANISM="Pterosperma sp., Strain CCMP1384" /LENGTH=246 /DNA_ID=CAMNT_0043484785 /DNA_START=22 /DNA_END=762 /DNA_ORIENTATION=+